MTKNMDICQQVSKKVDTIAWYFRYFVQTIVFFVMNQCSDHSESSATRSAAKFCIDIGGAFNLKRSSCKTYTFCVKFSYFPELGSFIEKPHHIYIYIYIYPFDARRMLTYTLTLLRAGGTRFREHRVRRG
jgi:putative hemolysin